MFAVALITLIGILTVFSFIDLSKEQLTYIYTIKGPFFMSGSPANTNTIICSLLWSNNTRTSTTLSTSGTFSETIYSAVELYQITWNSSSASNYTSLIDFIPTTDIAPQLVYLYIPDPTLPFFQYTFPVTDFYGMLNPYLRMTVNNASGTSSSIAEQINLNTTSSPTFVMTQYYTYTLTFVCTQGTYSQPFTAETSFTNTLPVLAAQFPTSTSTSPTATVERLNSTLIGITYQDPSNSTSSGSVAISHQSGAVTINDYSTSSFGNITTILWNNAIPTVDFNVNITAIINGVPYIWILAASESATTNPFTGIFDWLGQNTPTLPHIYTGWPAGMTSASIAEIVGACIVMLFLCVGSFRSAGACCIISWVIFGILLYMGWLGTITPYTIPEFAFSGFVGLLIHFSEAKDTAREV